MQIIFLVLPLALLLAAVAVLAFVWAVRSGQLDDLDTPAMRVLHDDEQPRRRSQRASNERRGAEAPGAAGSSLEHEPDQQDHRDPGDADRIGHAQ